MRKLIRGRALLLALTALALPAPSTDAATGRIAFDFQSTRDGGRLGLSSDIYLMDAGAQWLKPLTRTRSQLEYAPSWSPDGTRIVYESASVGGGQSDLWIMSSDGAGRQRLTRTPVDEHMPAWSPDGHTIAFVSSPPCVVCSGDLFLINADGSGRRPLTPGPRDEQSPSWSPDGTQILFRREAPLGSDGQPLTGTDSAIYATGPDGALDLQLTDFTRAVRAPVVSPDGRWVAFARYAAHRNRDDLVVMNRDGTGQRTISRRRGCGGGFPAFSPDSTKIAAVLCRRGRQYIGLFGVDGSGPLRLRTFRGGTLGHLAWTPTP